MSQLTVKSGDNVIGTDAHTRKWEEQREPVSWPHRTCRAKGTGTAAHCTHLSATRLNEASVRFLQVWAAKNLDTKSITPRSDSRNVLLSSDAVPLWVTQPPARSPQSPSNQTDFQFLTNGASCRRKQQTSSISRQQKQKKKKWCWYSKQQRLSSHDRLSPTITATRT